MTRQLRLAVLIGLFGGPLAQAAPIAISPAFTPNPMTVTGVTDTSYVRAAELIGSATSVDPATRDCMRGQFGRTPIMLEIKAGLPKVRLKLLHATAMLVVLPGGRYACHDSYPDTILALPLGTVAIYTTSTGGSRDAPAVVIEDLTETAVVNDRAQTARAAEDALCNGRPDTAARRMVVALACDRPSEVEQIAWRAMDEGDTDPLFPAAVVWRCGSKSRGQSRYRFEYAEWRYCDAMRKQVDETKLGIGLPDELKARVVNSYRTGVSEIGRQRSAMEEYGVGHPAEARAFDDAYVAALEWTKRRELRPLVHDIEAFVIQLDKGPGFAAGCVDKFRTPLAALVSELVKVPTGDALLDVFKTPRGRLLTAALALCYKTTGDQVHERWVLSLLGTPHLVASFHDVLWSALHTHGFFYDVDLEHQPLWRLPQVEGTDFDHSPGAAVATVKLHDDHATITFKKSSAMEDQAFDCKDGAVSGVHISGNDIDIKRDEVCKYRRVRVDTTPKPITVPVADVAKVTSGVTIADLRDDSDESKGSIGWVRRGKDLIWVAGFAAN